jgi:hypothetical protein
MTTRIKSKHLSAKARRAMPSKEFALPGKGKGPEGKGSGAYPIPDEGHARAALSRAAANASPAEQATIKRKVHERYPGIKIGGKKKAPIYRHPTS